MKAIQLFLLSVLIFACSAPATEEPSDNNEYPSITVPEGFEATMIYSPSENGQGSWVSLASDGQGRLLASDQYGKIYRLTVEDDGSIASIDSIALPVGRSQGMLWTPEALYVSVNSVPEDGWKESGLYKLTDTDGDDQYDTFDRLLELEGYGEHGPHSIILGPNGNDLYLIAGNHTLPPEEFTSVLNANWQTDRLFPSLLDPRGHANDIRPPGGWIARSADNGETWEIIASGFRNAYDIAFASDGQLFTYDSDMEWDLGSPWYRPTRVCHVIPGAEFGWRTGSGKWPAYYPDNLPGVLDIGQGSPTGITFGYRAAFPDNYQGSLFIADWSFGTIYRVELEHSGSSYSAAKSEFLSGSPLAISDLIIGNDGKMYFTTGGRRGTSYLYQVNYTGSEPTSPMEDTTPLPKEKKNLQEIASGNLTVAELIQFLGSDDRFIRYAARVMLEKMPATSWWSQVVASGDNQTILTGAIAAIRTNPAAGTFDILNGLDTSDYSSAMYLDLIRVYDLLFIRTDQPKTVPKNIPSYPTGDPQIDRELLELLVYLEDPKVIEPTLALMEAGQSNDAALTPVEVLKRSEQYGPAIQAMMENRPEEQALALAMSLSHLNVGWTEETRNRYFTWFYRALSKSGGNSYGGFVEKMRLAALNNVPESERARLAELSGETLLNQPVLAANVIPPEGPGRVWELNEARRLVDEQLTGRSFDRGKELYQALMCESCHMMNGEGGNIGPDLTQAGGRFSNTDLLNAMILPSMSISDQYGATLFKLGDGTTRIGRILRTTEDSVYVNLNPYSRETSAFATSEISSSEPSPVSLMPPGLINALNEDELLDLMAYLKSGGDTTAEYFNTSN